jgi:hypothetical protein
MKKIEKIITLIVLLALLFSNLPVTETSAARIVTHEADDALLLMLASHSMLSGEVLGGGNLKSARLQQQASANEVDILINLYSQQILELDKNGYNAKLNARLLDELETKVQALQAKSQRLEAERHHRRRGGFFRGLARALGRATGWVVSKAMQVTGKVVQFGIEEVGPQMIKDAVFSGTPLTGAAFRAKFREILRRRVRDALNHKVETRLAALSSEPAPDSSPPQPDSEPDQVIQSNGEQAEIVPDNDVVGTSSCAPLEVFEADVRKSDDLAPDIIVYANSEETASPNGYNVHYPPLPYSATMSQTARVLVQNGAQITVSTTQAVDCAGVLLIGDLITPASIYLDGELVWNGYLYPIVKEYPRPYRSFYVSFAVEPARPVSVSVVANSTSDDALSIWVPVEGFGFNLPSE